MRLLSFFDVISERTISEKRKFRRPMVMYHGTTDNNLRSILKQGVVPSSQKKVWADDPHVSAYDFSRASLEGSYWTSNLMTAYTSSTNATNKLGGASLIVMAQIAEASAYADEDSINVAILNALPTAYNMTTGGGIIPEAAAKAASLIYWGGWSDGKINKDNLLKNYINVLHTSLAKEGSKQEPVDESLMQRMLEAHIMRSLAYIADHESSGSSKDQYVKEMERLAAEGKAPEIPDFSEIENTIKTIQAELTKKYRKTAYADNESFSHTLRITEPVTFRGSNKILCIIGEKENWRETGATFSHQVPVILYYGTPPKDFFDQYSERKGSFPGATNPQGDMVIQPIER